MLFMYDNCIFFAINGDLGDGTNFFPLRSPLRRTELPLPPNSNMIENNRNKNILLIVYLQFMINRLAIETLRLDEIHFNDY